MDVIAPLSVFSNENLKSYESKIILVRGKKVMLDRDVALALGVTTGNLNLNSERSPKWNYLREKGIIDQYQFEMTKEEFDALLGDGNLPSDRALKHLTVLPTVYTNLGCAYFGTSMTSPAACEMAIKLSQVFVGYMEGTLGKGMRSSNIDSEAYSSLHSYLGMAALLGASPSLAKAQAVQYISRSYGLDLKSLLAENISDTQTLNCTPTELGKFFDPIVSAYYINKLLKDKELQIKVGKQWELTEEGKKFGVYLDVGKKHSSGTPIKQVKWNKDLVFPLISDRQN